MIRWTGQPRHTDERKTDPVLEIALALAVAGLFFIAFLLLAWFVIPS